MASRARGRRAFGELWRGAGALGETEGIVEVVQVGGDGAFSGRDRPWYTVEEFAALTARKPSAVRASIQRGEIPASKLGSRRYFIRKADVERMFEEGRGRG